MKAKTRQELARDTVAGVALLALAVLYWLGAGAIRISSLGGGAAVGAQSIPKALALILGVLAALLTAKSALALRTAAAVEKPEERREQRRKQLRAAGMLLIGIGFVAVLDRLGYIVSVVLLLGVTAVYNGHRLDRQLLFFAAGMAALYYLIFVRLLGIALPPGLWPAAWRALAG